MTNLKPIGVFMYKLISMIYLFVCFLLLYIGGVIQILQAADHISAKPNIILCMADDLGWGDTGYNGHPVLRTPNLDRMALEGIRFNRFYSGAPVCSPTRGSALTGRHPFRYGIYSANSGHIKKEEIVISEVLKNIGYRTGHFGKWHLGTLTTKIKDSNRGNPGHLDHYSPPWENGFDVCFSTEAKVPTWDPMKDPNSDEPYGTYYWTGPDQMVTENLEGDDSRIIMDRVVPFIRHSVDKKKPFMAVIWFHSPHLPVVSAPPYTDGYSNHKNYYGCITAMDEQMGRLRAVLQEEGIEENTMLWFCSDNGPEGNDESPGRTNGLRGRKRSLYEGGIRVPGLLIWPKMITESKIYSIPCSTNDYFPTIMDVLGYQIPNKLSRPFDGISLLPLLEGKMKSRPRPIAFESRDQLALTDNQYKIYSKDGGDNYELYDLIADPIEKNNLSNLKGEVVIKMKQTLDLWRRSCKESSNGEDYLKSN
jgi:arylsulfatase A-like enzyme